MCWCRQQLANHMMSYRCRQEVANAHRPTLSSPQTLSLSSSQSIKQEAQNACHIKAFVLATAILFGLQRKVLKLIILFVLFTCIQINILKNINVYLYAESYDSKDPKETATDDQLVLDDSDSDGLIQILRPTPHMIISDKCMRVTLNFVHRSWHYSCQLYMRVLTY